MEHWKEIDGYEGLYEVSYQGRVRSLKYGKEKILKPYKSGRGYLHVCLYKDGHLKQLFVHRLVAKAFIQNPNHLDTVNHKDEDKTNNTVSNLEWMSQKNNNNYGSRNKRSAEKRSKSVLMFDKSTGELLASFPSTNEAYRVTGIDKSPISKCCNGKRKSAGGYAWRYI